MRSIDDIVFGNAEWETRERNRAIAQSKRDTLKSEQVPWQALRRVWGDGPSDMDLLKWYQSADSVTRSLFE